jgi:2-oxoglutarate dehydrogenase E2 component (dihydrolipoamide succinyltransferase)
MKVEMVMPQMGESITEATVLKWLKNVGDEVKKDETILEISTDKVDSEIPAPASGFIVELIAQTGQTVPVKSVIAIIDTEKSSGVTAQAPTTQAPTPEAKPVAQPAPTQVTQSAPPPVTSHAAPQKPAPTGPIQLKSPLADDLTQHGVGISEIAKPQGSDKFYSPLVKNVAAQQGLSEADLSAIQGSGTQGRVTKQDVLDYVGNKSVAPVAEKKPAPAQPAGPALTTDTNGNKIEPFDNMRRRIAEHMVRSKATSPHVYTVNEVDLTTIVKWREKVQKSFVARTGFKLSYTPFFLEAAAKALAEYPKVNASVEGENLIIKKDVNVGCAVALGTTGLIVPVIKKADQLNLVGMAMALNDIATRARDKKLKPDDTQGGTFTVTNPGTFGSIIGYPIISQPQLAIMGVGAIKKRPMVVNDAIAIRDIVYITLSYDHRVIDGSLGGTFLNFIAKYLENWDINREL